MKFKPNSKKGGFSLIELIVVVAIMAVLVAVLAPSLLAYVERSRAQKDASAMGEVTNAVRLALADQDVYDELLDHNEKENVSCYIHVGDEAGTDDDRVSTQTGSTQYVYNDEYRTADETKYFAAGVMRGVTITFEPTDGTYTLAAGSINKFVNNKSKTVQDCATLHKMVKAAIGDTVEQTSQTYRNSEYTVFIKMGTLGGADAASEDSIQVYGQYSGMSLPVTAPTAYTKASNRGTDIEVEDPVEDPIEESVKTEPVFSAAFYCDGCCEDHTDTLMCTICNNCTLTCWCCSFCDNQKWACDQHYCGYCDESHEDGPCSPTDNQYYYCSGCDMEHSDIDYPQCACGNCSDACNCG